MRTLKKAALLVLTIASLGSAAGMVNAGVTSSRDIFTTGGHTMGTRDPFTDGGHTTATRDLFSDGAHTTGTRDTFTDGSHTGGNARRFHRRHLIAGRWHFRSVGLRNTGAGPAAETSRTLGSFTSGDYDKLFAWSEASAQ
ncbi:hypothetical protein OJJOAM_001464 [Cupriavidus sp. H18C1]|uniref:hypothetical protein n=1 Tax=Cupriavidus sp. H18C1 TaxID=3241601 RepID=UPI003BB88D6F